MRTLALSWSFAVLVSLGLACQSPAPPATPDDTSPIDAEADSTGARAAADCAVDLGTDPTTSVESAYVCRVRCKSVEDCCPIASPSTPCDLSPLSCENGICRKRMCEAADLCKKISPGLVCDPSTQHCTKACNDNFDCCSAAKCMYLACIDGGCRMPACSPDTCAPGLPYAFYDNAHPVCVGDQCLFACLTDADCCTHDTTGTDFCDPAWTQTVCRDGYCGPRFPCVNADCDAPCTPYTCDMSPGSYKYIWRKTCAPPVPGETPPVP